MNLTQYTVNSSGTLLDVAQAIVANQSRSVIVTRSEKVIGIISEGDLLRAFLRGTDINASLEPFIRHGISYLRNRDMHQALDLFRKFGISLVPIITENLILQDVITLQNLLAEVELVERRDI
jgi:CBS domain-containing protein